VSRVALPPGADIKGARITARAVPEQLWPKRDEKWNLLIINMYPCPSMINPKKILDESVQFCILERRTVGELKLQTTGCR
jgi:hypothetical protein